MYNILIKKANAVLSIDFDAMSPSVQRHLIEYGLRQKLNDAGSSATVKELGPVDAAKQALAMAENVLAALVRGEVSVRGTGTSLTLEERIEQRVIRAFFKQVCKRPVAKEVDQSNEALLDEIAKVYGKSSETIRMAMQRRINAEIEAEKAKPVLPTLDFDLPEA